MVVMKALWPVHSSRGSSAWDRLGGSQYQRALQWVAQDPNVSTVIVNMATFKDLEEDVAAVTSHASREEMERFEQAAALASKGTCHLCGACTAQCPKGVPVADIMRYRVYREGYGARRAFMLYRSIPPSRSALACQSCSECQAVCPRDVPVRAELLRVHEMLH
ncbi:MAG: hypothetical protein MUQ65_01185 [Armatimonadetes bacterium]|nr:hypothetical protein [Armatimonadota bacterium]